MYSTGYCMWRVDQTAVGAIPRSHVQGRGRHQIESQCAGETAGPDYLPR